MNVLFDKYHKILYCVLSLVKQKSQFESCYLLRIENKTCNKLFDRAASLFLWSRAGYLLLPNMLHRPTRLLEHQICFV